MLYQVYIIYGTIISKSKMKKSVTLSPSYDRVLAKAAPLLKLLVRELHFSSLRILVCAARRDGSFGKPKSVFEL